MYKASASILLPTSIIGSLPRPAWHTAAIGSRSFLEAMVNARWREQYEDAVSTHLRAQEVAGLDICTDGDAHYDEEIGGFSWQSYPLTHMAGFSEKAQLTPPAVAAASPARGQILHDQLEARVLPRIVGPLGPGNLQYAAMWKTAQRLTNKPIKFGTILPELLAAAVADDYYKDPVERCWAFSGSQPPASRALQCALRQPLLSADPHLRGDDRQTRRCHPAPGRRLTGPRWRWCCAMSLAASALAGRRSRSSCAATAITAGPRPWRGASVSRSATSSASAGNPVLLRQVSPLTEDAALGRLTDEEEKVRRYGDFRYAAKSWNVERRVIARVEATPQGTDSRFNVTNLRSLPSAQ